MKRIRLMCISLVVIFLAKTITTYCQDIFSYIKTGTIDDLKTYLKNGGDVNAKDTTGRTLLIWTALICDADFVKLLIDAEADVNITQNGFSPLMAATMAENSESVKLLIDARADVNAKNSQGYTPLILAASNGNSEIVKMLLAGKADPMIKDNEGNTAYNLASSNGHDVVSMMLLYPAKRLSAWNSIIPNHVTSRYLTDDRFNYEADTNIISMELDIGKKRALEFYRDELIKAGWQVDKISRCRSRDGYSRILRPDQ